MEEKIEKVYKLLRKLKGFETDYRSIPKNLRDKSKSEYAPFFSYNKEKRILPNQKEIDIIKSVSFLPGIDVNGLNATYDDTDLDELISFLKRMRRTQLWYKFLDYLGSNWFASILSIIAIIVACITGC